MRYYNFSLNTSSEQIKEKAKVKLNNYSYENEINAVNMYMYRTLPRELNFVAYREEDDEVFAVFSFDEKKTTFSDTLEEIMDNLNMSFQISKIRKEPEEITMFRFLESLEDARRREYSAPISRIAEKAGVWVWDYWNCRDDRTKCYFEFEEVIVPEKKATGSALYDQGFLDELANIEAHKNEAGFQGNMVHYIISSRSVDAASDMTKRLMQSLLAANRLGSRRMEIISQLEPDMYRKNNHLEDIIESNKGGVIVIDLSEKFGLDPVAYGLNAKYIEKLLKRHRNNCLFVFTYNMDSPGFAYQLLPNISKYVNAVDLMEGTGDRKAAISYLKALIADSEYAQYAGQAAEFMKRFPGKQFTQTDVLQAYEQFDSWCINKNIFKAYNFDANDGFYLDRSAAKEPPYERLQGLIGLEIVKKQIDTIIAADLVEKERKKRLGNDYKTSCMHMIFAGDPGTAKTTVAKLFAGIAKEKEILKSGAFVERGGMDLNGPFCVDMIRQAFEAARGGVLFIDEAYSLKQDVAVATLIQEMENKRDEVIVILAGYGERMERFLQLNEGLKSRIPNWIDFPNYSTDELTDIFSYIAHDRGFEATPEALEEARCIFEKKRLVDNFGNGRYVRNLFERATKNQAGRLLANGKTADKLKKDELFLLTKDDISCLEEDMLSEQPAGWAKKELEDMIGLTSAKKVIRKAIANFKMNKRYLEMDLTADRASLHMVFTGNPGTAKTTVARLFAQMLRDEKVLPTGQFVEVGRGDLISDHVGGTAPLVKEKFREAQGGVLFIDEAYSLCDDRKNSFGDEAISTIVQEMENNRDKVIVIFAGYPEPMKEFLDRNPGMSSRIAFRINFDDYSVDELCEITKLMVSKKKMSITDGAMEKLRNAYWKVNKTGDFGNGRFVRKLLEEAQMNLAVRLMDYADSDISQELLTTIEESDIPDATDFSDKPRKLGFGF